MRYFYLTQNIKMKSIAVLFSTLLLINYSQGQSVKDFIIPANPNNNATFYMIDTAALTSQLTRNISYSKKGNSYQITDSKLIDDNVSSAEMKTIQFLGNNVILKKSVLTSILEPDKIKTENCNKIIFVLPEIGKTSSWVMTDETIDEKKDTIRCTAFWTSVRINISQKKAIKVIKQIKNTHFKIIEYYVFGIGYWESEIEDRHKIKNLEMLNELEYIPEVIASSSNSTNIDNSPTLISKYEKLVIAGIVPEDPNVQTKYDERDMRGIFWHDNLSNASLYTREEIEKLGYEYVKVTIDDNDQITTCYRNCRKNLLLEVTEWYNMKISLDIEWFSNSVKHSIGYLMYCDL